MVEETSAATSSIRANMQSLQDLVGQFRTGERGGFVRDKQFATEHPDRRAMRLSA